MHSAGDIAEVQSVVAAGECGSGGGFAEISEIREGVEVRQGVEEDDLLDLVLRELGEGGVLLGGEGGVLGDEDGDAFVGVVGLILEGIDEIGGLEEGEEGVKGAGDGEEVGEVDVVRCRRWGR